MDIFFTLEAGIYLVKLEFTFATQQSYIFFLFILTLKKRCILQHFHLSLKVSFHFGVSAVKESLLFGLHYHLQFLLP